MAGKWHLGKASDTLPSASGFDRLFILADTHADNRERKPYFSRHKQANWYADGQPTTLPANYYASKTRFDKMIGFINKDNGSDSNAPFFTYVAFQAVHIPVQRPKEFTDRYSENYTDSCNELRQHKDSGTVDAGVTQTNLTLENMHTTADWATLTDAAKHYKAKSVAVYVSMIDAIYFHIVRLINHLKAIGEINNTLLVFTSDNSATPSDLFDTDDLPVGTRCIKSWRGRTSYSTQYETSGGKSSYHLIGPSFPSAAVLPLSFSKFFNDEGGIRVQPVLSKGTSPVSTT
jgi:arylsulfatase A-like enzyme